MNSLSRVRLFVTPWNVAHQAPPSMGFSRQEYWSGLPFPSPGHLPHPGTETRSPALQADALLSEPPGKTFQEKSVNEICSPLDGGNMRSVKGMWCRGECFIFISWVLPTWFYFQEETE